ncbi:unnamed protein product [Brassica rapa]|uniref:Uncharacterized protein n=1 Tax=Brassica campestris TaxID=3711 RepID=A0A3P6AUF9_BRACM|nr:unnamed protein product [Brassica rapa]VDC90804.1 unnamed protein product [Brassica rapa]
MFDFERISRSKMMRKGTFSIFKTRKERTRLKFSGLGGLKWKRLNLKMSPGPARNFEIQNHVYH